MESNKKPEYIQRMEVEFSELTEKIEKLSAFIDKKRKDPKNPPFSKIEFNLLVAQLDSMTDYQDILNIRLKMYGYENICKNSDHVTSV